MDRLNGFDSVAGYYDHLARLVFGRAMERSQTVFLADIPASCSVLVLGGGSGWWLKEFLATRPTSRILFVEPSGKMLEKARGMVCSDERVHFLHGTVESIDEENEFDVVLTFFVFDIFSDAELAGVIDRIKPLLRRDSVWLVSDFVDTKWWHRVLLFIMYRFFGAVASLENKELPRWDQCMDQKEFVERKCKWYYHDFIRAVVYETRRP